MPNLQPVQMYIAPTVGGYYANPSNMQVDNSGDIIAISGNGSGGGSGGAAGVFSGYDVIVFAGQSNMSGGYSELDPNLNPTRDGTGLSVMWDTDSIGYAPKNVIPAGDPMITPPGWDVVSGNTQSGTPYIGPAMGFIRRYVQTIPLNRKVLALNCAVGGTQLYNSRWAVGGDLYNGCLASTNAAMVFGTIPSGNKLVAILWVQGEADAAASVTIPQYSTGLAAVINGWRTSMIGASSSTPFVIGSMVYATNPPAEEVGGIISSYPNLSWMNACHVAIPTYIAYTSYTVGTNTSGGYDDIHYIPQDQRTNGYNLVTGLSKAIGNSTPPAIISTNPYAITDILAITATAGNASVLLSWTANTTGGATPATYQILNVTTSSVVGSTSLLNYTVVGLTNGTAYTFKVIPNNLLGAGPVSNFSTATPSGSVSPPGDVSAAASGTVTVTTIPVTFTAPSTGGAPTGYNLNIRAHGSGSYTLNQSVGLTGPYAYTGLTAATAYDLQIVATNLSGSSPGTASGCLISNVSTASGSGSPPGDVTALATGAIGTTTVVVTWTAPTTGGTATGYNLNIRAHGSGGYSINTTVGAVLTGTYTGLSSATAYDLQVVAINSYGNAPGTGSGALVSNVTTSGGTGVLDGISPPANVVYSLRKMLSAYSGPAIQVTRTSDSTTANIGFAGTALDSATLSAFCAGTNGYVSIWYDQSGNGNHQITTADGVRIVTSGSILMVNGKPSVTFNATNNMTMVASTGTVGDLFHVLSLTGVSNLIQYNVFNMTSGQANFACWNQTLNGWIWNTSGSPSQIAAITEPSGTPPSVLPLSLIEFGNSGGVFYEWERGTLNTATATASVSTFTLGQIGGDSHNPYFFGGTISEIIGFNLVVSGSTRTAISNNIISYYAL